ncbi:hypothetical protein SSUR61_0174 [Streptococcus suis R61]|uniref:Uncharacterized protein n=1 Tax=Streptococcus suis R61 TaxID=996306 RepID=A0AA87K2R3_STRSU|nr:hypothetical protein SSUR61_0174 [Streptococcus suis R61]
MPVNDFMPLEVIGFKGIFWLVKIVFIINFDGIVKCGTEK